MRTVLFGLDGATFTVLDRLVDEGLMPNLKTFYTDGVRAKLLSTPLPITPQAWTSMATGCYMGKHGVNDFVRIEIGDRGIFAKYNSSRDIHCDTIWKYASRHGRRVTALNYIGMAPPEPINGHSIPGFVPGRHLRRSSFPPDLFTRLEQVENFDVSILGLDLDVEKQVLKEMPEDQWLPWIDHHIAREQVWFAVMEHLMKNEPSDLTAIVFDGVDKLQHLAYRYLDPAWAPANPSPWESTVIQRCRDYFKQVDDFLGRTLDLIGDDGRVFIASDHGFTGSTELLYINTFLRNEGFLTWAGTVAEDDQDTVYVDRLQNHLGLIDIKRTKAFAVTPSCNGIFINVPPEEYGDFRSHLIDRLYSIQGPDGGQVITEIKVREEWFAGPYMNHAADLTLTLRDYGLISVLNGPEVVVPRKAVWGTHHPDGVLLGRGPGLLASEVAERRNIVDVAALLMYSLDLDISAEIDGRFPANMFDPAFLSDNPARIAQPAVATAAALDEVPEVEEMDAEDETLLLQRLRSLGYIE